MAAAVRFVVALGAICALVFPAGAPGVATPTNFRFTTPVPIAFIQATPHVGFYFAEPIETRVPRVGRATVAVEFMTCNPTPCAPTGEARLSVTVTTADGTLVISGGSNTPQIPSTGTWTVTEATGRFEGYTGAGMYTWVWSPNPSPFGTATLSLAGHLEKS